MIGFSSDSFIVITGLHDQCKTKICGSSLLDINLDARAILTLWLDNKSDIQDWLEVIDLTLLADQQIQPQKIDLYEVYQVNEITKTTRLIHHLCYECCVLTQMDSSPDKTILLTFDIMCPSKLRDLAALA